MKVIIQILPIGNFKVGVNYSKFSISQGFTLIEILVVVFIITTMAGMVVFLIGDDGSRRELQTEAKRIHGIIQMASEEAVISGQEYGLEVLKDGYLFWQWNEKTEKWQTPEDEKFQGRQFDGPYELTLDVEDNEFTLKLANEDEKENVFLGLSHDGEEARMGLTPDEVEDPESQDQDKKDEEDKDKKKIEPPIYILSSGEITPFKLTITLKDEKSNEPIGYRIESDGINPIILKSLSDEEE